MTHRNYMLALAARFKLGDRAAAVLALCARPVAPVAAKDAGATLLARLNEEERQLRLVLRRKWGVAAERIDPRLRTWQVTDGRDH